MLSIPLLVLALLLGQPGGGGHGGDAGAGEGVPILLYHRFGSVAADSMTVPTTEFASQLAWLRAHGYSVIPLNRLVDYLAGNVSSLPDRCVVITADDGHKSVYTDMFPLIVRYHVPVTLFIYPSAISNAKYAMTWEQLREMRDSGLVDIQSHTYWHPNFKREKKRLQQGAYEDFVLAQLVKSRGALEERLGGHVDMLAWPFGIYDSDLIQRARAAGYVAAFTLERRHARRGDGLMALPRYLMIEGMHDQAFARLLNHGPPRGALSPPGRSHEQH